MVVEVGGVVAEGSRIGLEERGILTRDVLQEILTAPDEDRVAILAVVPAGDECERKRGGTSLAKMRYGPSCLLCATECGFDTHLLFFVLLNA